MRPLDLYRRTPIAAIGRAMQTSDLRIALFSGNYNITVDGANKALNRLVGYLLSQGAQVRVYSPTVNNPDMEPVGDLVSLPSVPIPLRSEYRLSSGVNARIKRDLEAFNPNVIHVSAPDMSGHRVVTWARERGLPVLASVHTRFETYLRYYHAGFAAPLLVALQRRFYRRCDALVAPSESMAHELRKERMSYDIDIWSRGVDRTVFNSRRRDLAWRRELGLADEDYVIGFLSRLVMEKGLDVFADTIDLLRRRKVPHRVLIVGEGPAREWFEARLPGAVFTGFLDGEELGRSVASMDTMFFPSETEAFGNVTLEAMACGVPVVAAASTGSQNLIDDGQFGRLIPPGAVHGFAEALRAYARDPKLRARHGKAGEQRSRDFSWDQINQVVADTYLRLIRARQSAKRGA